MRKILLLGLLLVLGTAMAPYGSNEEGSGTVMDVGESVGAAGQGISVQVHEIIEMKKNDTLDIPQGQMVRIVAQNRIVEVDGESIPLNATLRVRVRDGDENEHVVAINSSENEEEIEIEEDGVKVKTKENLTITDDELLAGKNRTKVLIMPLAVPEKIALKTINSVVLHVVNETSYYEINGTRGAKVLWVFNVELPIQATINAQNGQVEKEQGPWWKFLVTSEE